MKTFLFFFIPIMFGIVIYVFAYRKQIYKIMKREDDSYTGLAHNTFDIYRIYKVLKNNKNLNREEFKLLKEILYLAIISNVLIVVYIILLFLM